VSVTSGAIGGIAALIYSASALAVGVCSDVVTVSCPGASNTPQAISMRVQVEPVGKKLRAGVTGGGFSF